MLAKILGKQDSSNDAEKFLEPITKTGGITKKMLRKKVHATTQAKERGNKKCFGNSVSSALAIRPKMFDVI